MATPVNAPSVPTYASRTPYLTPAEYLASPTGVDVTQLVVNGDDTQNADALLQTIARASSAVDTFCRQVLAATLDTQSGIYRVFPRGILKIKLDNTPILSVNDIAVGVIAGQLTSLSDLSGVWIGKKVIEVPISNGPVVPFTGSGKMYAVTKYVNGYANCLLTANVAEGATTLTVDVPLGIVAGMPLTIYDPGSTEQVTVQSITGNVITLTAGVLSAHEAGNALSALPPAVKQAAVLYTTALIKSRGDDSFVMPALGSEPSQTVATTGGGSAEVTMAEELLMIHRRTA